MRKIFISLFLAMFFVVLSGFNLENAIVPKKEIFSGGVPKDGIPAILEPKFIKASKVKYIGPKDRVIGVTINGQSRAYPLKVLNWHEVVNDSIAGVPFVVTF